MWDNSWTGVRSPSAPLHPIKNRLTKRFFNTLHLYFGSTISSNIKDNKAAWEEAFDHKKEGWGDNNDRRLCTEKLP